MNQMMMKFDTERRAEIILYDHVLVAYPVIKKVEKALTIEEKSIEQNEVVKTEREHYVITVQDGEERLTTYPGFWKGLREVYEDEGYTVYIHDERQANEKKGFPPPDLTKITGTRFSQKELLSAGLSANRSGLIGAPTRYGKTSLIVNTLRAYPTIKSCLVAPGVDLVKQLYDDMTEGKFKLEGRRVSVVCTGRQKIPAPILPGDVVICSVDSLDKLDPTEYDLLLADEPHELVTDGRLGKINAFTKARRIGFGATLTGRFDGRDRLIEGLFGPVIVERTYKEAVAEGAICPLEVIFLNVKIDPRHFFNRQRAYDSLFFRNPHAAELIAKMCHEVIPPDFQTLIFIRNEKQAEYLLDYIGTETCIAMAKRLTTKEREEVTEKLKGDKIKRCLCSKIYAKGMTFSDVRVLINAEAGGNNTSSIQKPGRLAEIRPGKKCGIILDFFFTTDPIFSTGGYAPWRALVIDSYARKKAYEDKGYEIAHVKTIEELKEKFEKLI